MKHRRSHGASILLAAAVVCTAVSTACGQAEPPAPAAANAAAPTGSPTVPPPTPLKTAADLGSAIQSQAKLVWGLHAVPIPEVEGIPSPASLADQWVLTQDDLEQLNELRSVAEKQEREGDSAGLSHTLDQATVLLRADLMRFYLAQCYQQWRTAMEIESRLMKPLLGQKTPAERDAIQGTLQESNTDVVAATQQALRSASYEALARALKANRDSMALYSNKREALAKSEPLNPAIAPGFLTRGDNPCPPPAPGTSGTPGPRLRQGASPLDYPQELRYMGIEGTVVVNIIVSDTGCVTHGQVVQSSGVPQLDRAALTWVQKASFLPADKDHHAVAYQGNLPVNYRLQDDGGTHESTEDRDASH